MGLLLRDSLYEETTKISFDTLLCLLLNRVPGAARLVSPNAMHSSSNNYSVLSREPAIHISSNEAYHVVSQTGGVVTTHTPTPHPSQPAPPATADAVYEPIH